MLWLLVASLPPFQSTLQERQTTLCSKCLCLDSTFVDSGAADNTQLSSAHAQRSFLQHRPGFSSTISTLNYTCDFYLKWETPLWQSARFRLLPCVLGPALPLLQLPRFLTLRDGVWFGPLFTLNYYCRMYIMFVCQYTLHNVC